jgi:FLVCR family MFS transporter 7
VLTGYAVRKDNTGPLFAVFAIMGTSGVIMLPLTLELAVEQTGSADASSAVLYFVSNVFTIILILGELVFIISESH